MHDADLENLIAAFHDGDPAAFTQVWERYLHQIVRDITRFTSDYDERQELLQVIRIALYQSRQHFAGSGDFGAWVQGISRQRCLQWARTNRRLQSSINAFGDTIDPLVDIESEVEAAANEYDRLCERVIQAMCDLTQRQREVVERRIVHRQPVSTVAADLHCAIGTVKATSHIALSRLRQRLQDPADQATNDSGFGKIPSEWDGAL